MDDSATQSCDEQRCTICGSEMEPYFSKTYQPDAVGDFLTRPLDVDYDRCPACGFVGASTHRMMPAAAWARLNEDFHHHLEANVDSVGFNQPPYQEQAFAIAALVDAGIIGARVLDYGSGYGSMARLARKFYGLSFDLYDPYVQMPGELTYVEAPRAASYDLVICSAMFEHVLERAELDAVNAPVGPSGALMIHTLVCENVPADPDWFYLGPIVHCSFHTNASMRILMEQWGYTSSIYSLNARSWWLLKETPPDIEGRLAAVNRSLGRQWFLFADGFLDYWK